MTVKWYIICRYNTACYLNYMGVTETLCWMFNQLRTSYPQIYVKMTCAEEITSVLKHGRVSEQYQAHNLKT